jgi:hypothetical protein
MTSHELIPLDNPKQWEKALHEIPFCYAHTHEYARIIEKCYNHPVYLYHYKTSSNAFVCPLALRTYNGKKSLFSPYGNGGFTGYGNTDNFQEEFSGFLKKLGFVTVFISLNQYYDWSNLFKPEYIFSNKPMYTIDLSLPLEQLEKNLKRNNRRLIRRWHETDHLLTDQQNELHHYFINNYHACATRMNVDKKYQFPRQVLNDLYEQCQLYYLGVNNTHNGNMVAVRSFLYTPFAADAFLECHEPNEKQHSRILYWEGIKYLKSLHIQCLNLSGGIKKNDTIDFFKSTLGGQKTLHKTVKIVLNRDMHNQLCDNIPTEKRNTFFPPYHNE